MIFLVESARGDSQSRNHSVIIATVLFGTAPAWASLRTAVSCNSTYWSATASSFENLLEDVLLIVDGQQRADCCVPYAAALSIAGQRYCVGHFPLSFLELGVTGNTISPRFQTW